MAKLTLRDLFALVTILALALGWWVDHRKMAREYDELRIEYMTLVHTEDSLP